MNAEQVPCLIWTLTRVDQLTELNNCKLARLSKLALSQLRTNHQYNLKNMLALGEPQTNFHLEIWIWKHG